MNIFKTIKNRINQKLTNENSEAGFSMVEGVVSISIMTTCAVVGVGMIGEDGGYTEIINNAKAVQTSSLVSDVMTNVVFYDLDGDSETNLQSAVNDFNNVNSEKGFTAFAAENNDCVAIQVAADNGLNSIKTNGVNCDSLVENLKLNAEKIKEENDVIDVPDDSITVDETFETVKNSIPREVMELFDFGE